MRAYLLSRLAQTALVVFLSLTAVFFLERMSGDPVRLFLPMDVQAKDVNEFRQRLGFNDPLPVEYARFVSGAVRGDFGEPGPVQIAFAPRPCYLSLTRAPAFHPVRPPSRAPSPRRGWTPLRSRRCRRRSSCASRGSAGR